MARVFAIKQEEERVRCFDSWTLFPTDHKGIWGTLHSLYNDLLDHLNHSERNVLQLSLIIFFYSFYTVLLSHCCNTIISFRDSLTSWYIYLSVGHASQDNSKRCTYTDHCATNVASTPFRLRCCKPYSTLAHFCHHQDAPLESTQVLVHLNII